jgi:hypothetical protein
MICEKKTKLAYKKWSNHKTKNDYKRKYIRYRVEHISCMHLEKLINTYLSRRTLNIPTSIA